MTEERTRASFMAGSKERGPCPDGKIRGAGKTDRNGGKKMDESKIVGKNLVKSHIIRKLRFGATTQPGEIVRKD